MQVSSFNGKAYFHKKGAASGYMANPASTRTTVINPILSPPVTAIGDSEDKDPGVCPLYSGKGLSSPNYADYGS
jgi:hypothetical protein